MRTREMSYADYGIKEADLPRLFALCRDRKYRKELREAADQANPAIADDLIYHILYGISFDRLNALRDIPMKKDDFYAYKRKMVAIFRDLVKNRNCNDSSFTK